MEPRSRVRSSNLTAPPLCGCARVRSCWPRALVLRSSCTSLTHTNPSASCAPGTVCSTTTAAYVFAAHRVQPRQVDNLILPDDPQIKYKLRKSRQ